MISRCPQIIDKLRDSVPDVLDPVQFSEAWPGAGVKATTFFTLDYESNISYSDSAMTALGPANYTEDGKLNCYLMLTLPGKEAVEVRERAHDIANAFSEWVRAHPTLDDVVCGGPVWVSGVQWTPGMANKARDGALKIELSWHDNDV